MELTIPDSHLGGFKAFMKLSAAQRAEVIRVAESTPPVLPIRNFATQVAKSIAWLDDEQAYLIFRAICGFYLVGDEINEDPDSLVEAMRVAFERNKISVSDEDWQSFATDLRRVILSEGSLATTAKALQLRTQHQVSLESVRILTETRPVFSRNAEEGPLAAVVYHLLYLAVDEDRKERTISIALTRDDLDELAKAVARAKTKEKTLRNALERADIVLPDNTGDR